MRKIDFREPNNPEWIDWRIRCEEKRDALVQAVQRGEKVTLNKRLYKEMKVDVYTNYELSFRGKCAYCERDIHNQPGDIEHYRPEKRVTDANGRPVTRVQGGQVERHRGYYWLAYEWTNLLPACITCNRPGKAFTEGRLIGKWDRFPVRNFRAWGPGEESDEDPLLLNPVKDDPTEHLKFDVSGVIGWRSDKGEMTINILGLNDRGLPRRRREEYWKIRTLVAEYFNLRRGGPETSRVQELWRQLEQIGQGYGEFTTYAIMAINDEISERENGIAKVKQITSDG